MPMLQPDTLRAAQDTVVSILDIPTRPPEGIERVMLAEDKLYVVLAVVLVIWFGLLAFLFMTERRLRRLEAQLPSTPDLLD